MTTSRPRESQSESHQQHPAPSSTLSAPPSSPHLLLHPLLQPQPQPQPKPLTLLLPPQPTRSKSVSLTSTTTSKTPTATTTKRPPKPTFSEVSSLYQYTWERIDDLKLITGALCEKLIALEDTVATLDEEDSMEIFTKKAFDMATEGQLIAMIAEQFKETGSMIAERATRVGLWGNIDGDGNGNWNGEADGKRDKKGNGSGTAENQGKKKQRAATVSDPDTGSDPDL